MSKSEELENDRDGHRVLFMTELPLAAVQDGRLRRVRSSSCTARKV